MSEFTLPQEDFEKNDPNIQERFKNVKEIKVGNGRWKQDSEALRGYDDDGNCVFIIEL